MDITINGQPVTAFDITTDEGGITMRMGLGLGLTMQGGDSDPTHRVLVVAIGQSNMTGRAAEDGSGPYFPAGVSQLKQGASAFSLVPTTWDAGVSGSRLDHLRGGPLPADPDEFGPGRHFAIAWAAAAPDDVLYFVPRALGGSAIALWKPDGSGSLYNTAVADANTAAALIPGGPNEVVFIWNQGESDQGSTTYQAELDAVINGFRADVTGASSASPFIVGGGPQEGALLDANVQAATQGARARISYTGYADPSIPTEARIFDAHHLNTASMRVMGAAYHDGYVAAKANTSPGSGPITFGSAGFKTLSKTATNTFTAATVAIGTAAADRVVLVVVAAQEREQNSMTIGGVTATRIGVRADNGTSNSTWVYAATVPTGTTADVVMTLKSGEADFVNMGVAALPIYGARAAINGDTGWRFASGATASGVGGLANDLWVGITHANGADPLAVPGVSSAAFPSMEINAAGFSDRNRFIGIGAKVMASDFTAQSFTATVSGDGFVVSGQSTLGLVLRPL
jgi:hypothetical protein